MVGMRKHIYRLNAIEIVPFFDQVFHISLLCFGIAGDVTIRFGASSRLPLKSPHLRQLEGDPLKERRFDYLL